jgi:quinol monooxygenase YgiN
MSFIVIARWTARPGTEDRVRRALAALAPPSREEPGCLAYRPAQSTEDPCDFLIYEEYVDESAYHAHAASEHFRRHAQEEGIPLLASRERTYFTPLDDPDSFGGPEAA